MRWDEARPHLPKGWVWAELGELASTQLGKMLSAESKRGRNPQPYLRNQNVQWGHFELDDLAEMDFTDDEMEKFSLRPGDVIVCEGGEVGRAAVWPAGAPRCLYQKALHRVRPGPALTAEYLRYALEAAARSRYLDPFTSGSTIKHLPQEDLRRLPVPLAPLAEQKRLVMELERRLSHLDAGVASLKASRRRLAVVRTAVLQSAAAGRLTTPVSASDDLRRLCDRLGIVYSATDAPPGWITVELGDIATIGSGATPKRTEPRYWVDGDIPWVTSGQVSQRAISQPAGFITKEALDETSVRMWPSGTLLMAMYGEGKTRGNVAELLLDATCNQACAAICLRDEFQPARRFIWLALQARYEENRRLGGGGVQENLNLGLIRGLRLALPSFGLQLELVAEAERRLSLLDAAERAVDASLIRAGMLRRSLLAAAFAGRLVPQDPADEPADVVLDRLREDRQAQRTPNRMRTAVEERT